VKSGSQWRKNVRGAQDPTERIVVECPAPKTHIFPAAEDEEEYQKRMGDLLGGDQCGTGEKNEFLSWEKVTAVKEKGWDCEKGGVWFYNSMS